MASTASMSSDNRVDERRPQPVQRFLSSLLPCVPGYEPRPETPNIDKLRELFARFKGENPNETDHSVLDRVNSHELCKWSEKVLQYLPSVDDSHNADESSKQIVQHFTTLKRFYSVTKSTGIESDSLDLLFNSMQIYEGVIAIAFVALKDHPDTMKAITSKVSEAIDQVEGHKSHGCLTVACFGAALLSQYNKILRVIDEKIGQLGIVGVAEFFAQIIEVFCRFFNIDVNDLQNITAIGETISQMISGISATFGSIFGNSIPAVSRRSKYSPLAMTERIKAKLAKFETPSKIVERTVGSFENFYQAIEKVDDDLVKLKQKDELKMQEAQSRTAAVPQDAGAGGDDEDTRKVDVSPQQLAAKIADKNSSTLEELNLVGRFFKHLETILSYGILLFKNEDEILNPLLDHVDECTRILGKFAGLHPLYKVLCGTNFLSKLKVVMKKIVHLLETSKLKMNNPREFLAELSRMYPNLLGMVCESLLGDSIKKLPDPIENVLNDALNSGLNKLKNKLKF